MKRLLPTPDEAERIEAINVLLKPAKFGCEFFNKGGLKASERPFRIFPVPRHRDLYIRYFETIEGMEKYANRVIDERNRVDNLNVTLKMFDAYSSCKIRWVNSKCYFDLTLFEDDTEMKQAWRSQRVQTYDRIAVLEERCHRLIRETQAAAVALDE